MIFTGPRHNTPPSSKSSRFFHRSFSAGCESHLRVPTDWHYLHNIGGYQCKKENAHQKCWAENAAKEG